ncbi:hypothetical protein [Eikenella sp. NML070372]|uniref:hypothetical protein n=1 Tax=Eikenella sp. NML070372 TaxID=1795829 RepID=UPI0007E2A8D3|nr:hypothetical protein [Eikenella sp. NML070372]OAM32630.1 hypothetical protein A7P97_09425 [Eikenella sp. NML070372]
MSDENLITEEAAEDVAPEQEEPAAEAQQPAEAEKQAAPEQQDKPAAPEQYRFTAAEGKEYDADVLKEYEAAAREIGLDNDQANLMLGRMAGMLEQRHGAQMEALSNQWAQQSRTDAEFGGDKLNENMAVAKRALQQYGSPELTDLLNQSGLGNHPAFIRMFYRVGLTLREDGMVNANKGEARSAQSFYNASNMNP